MALRQSYYMRMQQYFGELYVADKIQENRRGS